MLVIRFARRGRSNRPFYDIVVAEKSRPVQKKFVTKLGYFNPLADNGAGELVYDKDMTKKYIGNGAQCSQAVARLLTKDGLKEAGKFIKARASKPKKEEPKPEPVEEAPAEAAETTEEAPAEETPTAEAEAAPAEEPKAEEAPQEATPETEAKTEEA